MIADGLKDPWLHLEAAKQLYVPLDGFSSLHPDLAQSAAYITSGADVARVRVQTIIYLERFAAELRPQRDLEWAQLGENFAKLPVKPHTPLMEYLGNQVCIEDHVLPKLLLTGLPIIGPAAVSPFFLPKPKPSALSLIDFVATAPDRRLTIIEAVLTQGRRCDPAQARAVFEKTQK